MKTAWRMMVLVSLIALLACAVELPAGYYRIMEAGCASVEKHLDEQPGADLNAVEHGLERHTGSSLEVNWARFGYAILPLAVLYAKQHPANMRYHDPKMLALALRIGDLLAEATAEVAVPRKAFQTSAIRPDPIDVDDVQMFPSTLGHRQVTFPIGIGGDPFPIGGPRRPEIAAGAGGQRPRLPSLQVKNPEIGSALGSRRYKGYPCAVG